MAESSLQQYLDNVTYTMPSLTYNSARVRINGIQQGFWNAYDTYGSQYLLTLYFTFGMVGELYVPLNSSTVVLYQGERCIEFDITGLTATSSYTYVSEFTNVPTGWTGFGGDIRLNIARESSALSTALSIIFTTMDNITIANSTFADVFNMKTKSVVSNSSGIITNKYIKYTIKTLTGTVVTVSEYLSATINGTEWTYSGLSSDTKYILITSIYNDTTSGAAIATFEENLTTLQFSPTIEFIEVSQQAFVPRIGNLPYIGTYNLSLTCNGVTYTDITTYNSTEYVFGKKVTYNMARTGNILVGGSTYSVSLTVAPTFITDPKTITSSITTQQFTASSYTCTTPSASWHDLTFQISVPAPSDSALYLDNLTYVVNFVNGSTTISTSVVKASGIQTVTINTSDRLNPYTNYTIITNVYDTGSATYISLDPITAQTAEVEPAASFTFNNYIGTFSLALVTTESYQYRYQLGSSVWSDFIDLDESSTINTTLLNKEYTINYTIYLNEIAVSSTKTITATTPTLSATFNQTEELYHQLSFGLKNMINGLYYVKYTISKNSETLITTDYIEMNVISTGEYGHYNYYNVLSSSTYHVVATIYQYDTTYYQVGQIESDITTKVITASISLTEARYIDATVSVECSAAQELDLYFTYNVYQNGAQIYTNDKVIDLEETTSITLDSLLTNTAYTIAGIVRERISTTEEDSLSLNFQTNNLNYTYTLTGGTSISGSFTVTDIANYYFTYQVSAYDYTSSPIRATGSTFNITPPYYNTSYSCIIKLYINDVLSFYTSKTATINPITINCYPEAVTQHYISYDIDLSTQGTFYYQTWRSTKSETLLYDNTITYTTDRVGYVTDLGLIGAQSYTYEGALYQKLQTASSFTPLATNSILVGTMSKQIATPGIPVQTTITGRHQHILNFDIVAGESGTVQALYLNWYICPGTIEHVTLEDLPTIRASAVAKGENISTTSLAVNHCTASSLSAETNYYLVAYVTEQDLSSSGIVSYNTSTIPTCTVTASPYSQNVQILVTNMSATSSYKIVYTIGDFNGSSVVSDGSSQYSFVTTVGLIPNHNYTLTILIYDLGVSESVAEQTITQSITTAIPNISIISNDAGPQSLTFVRKNNDTFNYNLEFTIFNVGTQYTETVAATSGEECEAVFSNLLINTEYTVLIKVYYNNTLIYTYPSFTISTLSVSIIKTNQKLDCFAFSADFNVDNPLGESATFVFTLKQNNTTIDTQTIIQTGTDNVAYLTTKLDPTTAYTLKVNYTYNNNTISSDFTFTSSSFNGGIKVVSRTQQSIVVTWENFSTSVNYSITWNDGYYTTDATIDNTNINKFNEIDGISNYTMPINSNQRYETNSNNNIYLIITPSGHTTSITKTITASTLRAIPSAYTVNCESSYSVSNSLTTFTLIAPYAYDYLKYNLTVKLGTTVVETADVVKAIGATSTLYTVTATLEPFTTYSYEIQVYDYDQPSIARFTTPITGTFTSASPAVQFGMSGEGSVKSIHAWFSPANVTLDARYRYDFLVDDQIGHTWQSALYELDQNSYHEIANVVTSATKLAYTVRIYPLNSSTIVYSKTKYADSSSTVSDKYLSASVTYVSITPKLHNLSAGEYSVYYDIYRYGSSTKIASSDIITGTSAGTDSEFCPYDFNNLISGTKYTIKAYISSTSTNYTASANYTTHIISGCLVQNITSKIRQITFNIANMPTTIEKKVDIYVDGILNNTIYIDKAKSIDECTTTSTLTPDTTYTIKVIVSDKDNAANYQEFAPFTATTASMGTLSISNIKAHGFTFIVTDYEGDTPSSLVYNIKYGDNCIYSGTYYDIYSAVTVNTPLILSLTTYTLVVEAYDDGGYLIYSAHADVTTIGSLDFNITNKEVNFNSIVIQMTDIGTHTSTLYADVYLDSSPIRMLTIAPDATSSDEITISSLVANTEYFIAIRVYDSMDRTHRLAVKTETVKTLTWGNLKLVGAGNNYIACQLTDLLFRRPLEIHLDYSTDGQTWNRGYTQSMNQDAAINSSIINITGLQAATQYYIRMEIINGWDGTTLLYSQTKSSSTTNTTTSIQVRNLTKTSITVALVDATYANNTTFKWRLIAPSYSVEGDTSSIQDGGSADWTPVQTLTKNTTYNIKADIYNNDNIIVETISLSVTTLNDKQGLLQQINNNINHLSVYVTELEELMSYSIVYTMKLVTYDASGNPSYGSAVTSPIQYHTGATSGIYSFSATSNTSYLVTAQITDSDKTVHIIEEEFKTGSACGDIAIEFLPSAKVDFYLYGVTSISVDATINWTVSKTTTVCTGTSYVYARQTESTRFTTPDALTSSTSYTVVAVYTPTGSSTPITIEKIFRTPAAGSWFTVEFVLEENQNVSYRNMQEMDVIISGFDIDKTYRLVKTYTNVLGQTEFYSEEEIYGVTSHSDHVNRFEPGKQYNLQVDIYQLTPTTATYTIYKSCPILNEPYRLNATPYSTSATIRIIGIDIGYTTFNTLKITNIDTNTVITKTFNIETQNYEDASVNYYYDITVDSLTADSNYQCILQTYNTNNELQFTRNTNFTTLTSNFGFYLDTSSTKNSIRVETTNIPSYTNIIYYLYNYTGSRCTALVSKITHTSIVTTSDVANFANLSSKTQYLLSIVGYKDNMQCNYSIVVGTLSSEGTYPRSEKWSWSISNTPEKNATATQTQLAKTVLDNNASTEYPESVRNFSFFVWDDLVAKINAIRTAVGLEWNDTYGSVSATKMYHAGEGAVDRQLTAMRMKALYYNIDYQEPTGEETELTEAMARGDIAYGKPVKSQYFYDLVTLINAWIEDLN